MIWIQVIFFVVSNIPTLIKAIRELIDLFDGDETVAASVLEDLKSAKMKGESYEGVIAKYKK